MKLFILVLSSFAFVLSQNNYESIGFTNPDDISLIVKYELSEYVINNLRFEINGNFVNRSNLYNESKGYDYNLGSSYYYQNFSEEQLFALSFNNNFEQSNNFGNNDNFYNFNGQNFLDKSIWNNFAKDNILILKLNTKKYSEINYGIDVSILRYYSENYSNNKTQSFNYNIFTNNYDFSSESSLVEESYIRRNTEFNLFLSIGKGKIRYINPLINALRLNERYQTITGKVLSESEILKLSEIINQRGTFDNKYDRSAKYFFPALFESTENLNSLNYSEKKYLEETIYENERSRFEGIETDIGILINHTKKSPSLITTYYSPNDSFYYQYLSYFEQDLEINIYGPQFVTNYYKNISLYSQFNIRYQVAYLLTNIVKQNTDNSSLLQNLSLSYIYNFTDRLIFNNSLNFYNAQNKIKSKDIEPIFETKSVIFDTNFKSTLSYYVENSISMDLSASFIETNINSYFQRANAYRFGMTYYILRE